MTVQVILSLHDFGALPEGFGFSAFEFDDVTRIERIDADEQAATTEDGKASDSNVDTRGKTAIGVNM